MEFAVTAYTHFKFVSNQQIASKGDPVYLLSLTCGAHGMGNFPVLCLITWNSRLGSVSPFNLLRMR